MPTKLFEQHSTSLRLEMFTVINEGFQQWDPAPKSAEAKAFLVITAEDLGNGAFATQVVGLSLNGLKALLGGWELTGIFTASSGAPLTVRAGVDRSLNGQGLDTADQVGDWKISGGRPRNAELLRWFNTAAFALPAIGTIGTSGIDIVRGPALSNLDLAMFRNFQVGERLKFQFRAEFFNALNHTVLGNPNTTLTNGNFGKILGTATPPRVGELGLKASF